jgi:glycosyltransferase involved in cell wall biosynthesis
MEGFTIHRHDLMHPEIVRERKKKQGYAADIVWPELQGEIREFYRRFVQQHDIDVVHAHNFHHFLPEHGLALTELYEEGLPTFLTVHEVWSEFICKDLLNRTKWNRLITVSEHVGEELIKQAPEVKDNLTLIYHGIDTDLFSPENRTDKWAKKLGLDGRPVVIHPARMLPWKGVIYTVEALDILRREFQDLALIITDTDDIVDWIDELQGYKKEVLRAIRERGLTDYVITQSFPYMDLPGVYNHCDVVVYPTIGEEPFGLVPVEGMACAKPVVVTKSGGLVESVVDGKTGFIIEKRDPEALAEKIAVLLRDPKLARTMGKAGRAHAVAHFTRQRMAAQVAELYQETMIVAAAA